jgi:hypothetical protein
MAISFRNYKWRSLEGKVDKPFLTMVLIVLFFLILCWGIWWFFDYRMKELKHEILPQANEHIIRQSGNSAIKGQHNKNEIAYK